MMNASILARATTEESIEIYATGCLTRFYDADGNQRMERTAFHFPTEPVLAIVEEPATALQEAAGEALCRLNARTAPKAVTPARSWWAWLSR